MTFARALDIRPGVTAVIGSGGKTSLLTILARELAPKGRVLLCTTTRMYPVGQTVFAPTEDALAAALDAWGVVCAGERAEAGKLSAPLLPMNILCKLTDFVLVEADGSKRLPLKAHAAHEPVIPTETGQTICVVGLSGLGRPIGEAAHRAERYAALAGAALTEPVTPELAARVLNAEGLGDQVFLNQADDAAAQALARELQRRLTLPAVIGSLKENFVLC